MTSKDYFRNLAFLDLGFTADEKVIELETYITEILLGAKQQIGTVGAGFYDNFGSKLLNDFNLTISDIQLILLPYIKSYILPNISRTMQRNIYNFIIYIILNKKNPQ